MNSWKEFGAVVSDPRPGDDTPLWDELLSNAAAFDAQLYVKLIGLRLALHLTVSSAGVLVWRMKL